jgi:membrane dipeptidase
VNQPDFLIKTPKLFIATLASALLLVACGPSDAPTPQQQTPSPASMAAQQQVETEEQLIERARAIHERVITLDTHADINTANFTLDNNYTMELDTQVTLPKMIAGGLDVAWFIVYTGQGPLTEEGYAAAYANALDKFEAIDRLVTEIAPDTIEIAYTADDVRRIAASGKKVAMIGIENAYPLGTDISKVREFYERGGRYMSLAHNGHSQFADSNTGEASGEWLHNGLSELGRQAIAEMNKWGIIIDVSHPSMEANRQAIELSKAPVMASHSSARALDPNVSRNLWDEELLAIRDNGGVVHAVAFRSYLDSEKHARNREALAAQRTAAEIAAVAPPVDIKDFVDHIDYMVNLIGIDHVGISSDFDGGGGIEGWQDASETFNVTLELVRRGYSEQEIAKLWSENLFRVMDEVAQVAQEIQAAEGV